MASRGYCGRSLVAPSRGYCGRSLMASRGHCGRSLVAASRGHCGRSLVVATRDYCVVVVHGLLIAVAPLVVGHRLWGAWASAAAMYGLSGYGSRSYP